MEEFRLKLSPSSASDFKSCPQLFKYRSIDNLQEPVSEGAARGSLVHLALERLFAEDARNRTMERAEELLQEVWREFREDPEFRPDELEPGQERAWLAEGRRLLNNLFRLEDPSASDPRRLEWWVEYELEDLHLRGIIDRLEVRRDGSWVLTDYKTGRVPGESRELTAFFGLRFYALVCWRSFGVMPREIRLVYLNDPAVLTLNPDIRMLEAYERQMIALGKAIRRAVATNDWRPRPSPFCMGCHFQTMCPAWSGAETKTAEP
ncbi:MAG: PD-(D/E)XK nuclease family protein [Actinomycetota bacterium]|nr:PD-(D/E)XK nuclease family protein [Actinomycetota bacterium]